MTWLLALLAVLTVAGLVYLRRHRPEPEPPQPAAPSRRDQVGCCGAHEVCLAESLLALSPEIIYYDDEELDQYANRPPEEYTTEQVDTFRDIMLTLKPHEVAGWLRSLQLRAITPPYPIRDEALLLVDEFRRARQ